jgi:hypothetical protein
MATDPCDISKLKEKAHEMGYTLTRKWVYTKRTVDVDKASIESLARLAESRQMLVKEALSEACELWVSTHGLAGKE